MLELLVAGDLPEDEAVFYHRHIAACPGCREKYERAVRAHRAMKNGLTEAIPAQSEVMDVWPAVRTKISHPERRRSAFGWLNPEPVRGLVIAGALTLGLYLVLGVRDTDHPGGMRQLPVYESNSVIVSTAKVDQRPARVSSFESGDGETVFLWLE